jgi:hypothetical protein
MAGLEPKNNSIFQNPKSQIGTVNLSGVKFSKPPLLFVAALLYRAKGRIHDHNIKCLFGNIICGILLGDGIAPWKNLLKSASAFAAWWV